MEVPMAQANTFGVFYSDAAYDVTIFKFRSKGLTFPECLSLGAKAPTSFQHVL